jgi:hypothetical protein
MPYATFQEGAPNPDHPPQMPPFDQNSLISRSDPDCNIVFVVHSVRYDTACRCCKTSLLVPPGRCFTGTVKRHPAGRIHPENAPISKSYRRADTIYLCDLIKTIPTSLIISRSVFLVFYRLVDGFVRGVLQGGQGLHSSCLLISVT